MRGDGDAPRADGKALMDIGFWQVCNVRSNATRARFVGEVCLFQRRSVAPRRLRLDPERQVAGENPLQRRPYPLACQCYIQLQL